METTGRDSDLPSGHRGRSGRVVVLVGPDGTGKSSLADRLERGAAERFSGVRRLHWRPMVLPRPADLRRATPRDTTQPHAAPPHPRLVSLALLLYYWLDFVLGYVLVLRPARRRGELVLLERGWFDMVVDPHRYRLAVSPGLTRRLGSLLPSPDLRVVLDAAPRVVHQRKPELDLAELDRQRGAWRELAKADVVTTLFDATAPLDELARRVSQRFEDDQRAGWVVLPSAARARVWIPRAPRSAAREGLAGYQPSAGRARAAVAVLRLLVGWGAARLLPAVPGGPREVRALLGPHVPPGGTYALLRTNHPGRYVARILDRGGRPFAHAKLVTAEGDPAPLATEADALRRLAPQLTPPVRAPQLRSWDGAVLVTEALTSLGRRAPATLPEPVAAALGRFWAGSGGACHGDCAPWNLLRVEGGWALVDWEHGRAGAPPFWDLLHFLTQAHAHLGRPSRQAMIEGVVGGRGPVGAAVDAYAAAAGLDADVADDALRGYLVASNQALRPMPDGRPEGGERRAALLDALR